MPTVAESGLPGFDVTSWYGLVVRAGTPPAIVQKIQRDVGRGAARATTCGRSSPALGLEPVGNTPEEFARMIDAESRKWSEIVRKANIKPQQ